MGEGVAGMSCDEKIDSRHMYLEGIFDPIWWLDVGTLGDRNLVLLIDFWFGKLGLCDSAIYQEREHV